MNKINLRETLIRKISKLHQRDNEIFKRKVIYDMVSNFTYENVELILRKQKPLYYDIKTNKNIYLT